MKRSLFLPASGAFRHPRHDVARRACTENTEQRVSRITLIPLASDVAPAREPSPLTARTVAISMIVGFAGFALGAWLGSLLLVH